MANRLVFLPTRESDPSLYIERMVSFEWVPGIAISQGTKSVINLHNAAKDQLGISKLLEISTRSQEELGIRLSAFNLLVNVKGAKVSVEAAYQSAKVFDNGGPFLDLLKATSMEAKQDPRLKNSGTLIEFSFDGNNWPLSPTPNFYDYLYISGLMNSPSAENLAQYEGFTDIAFSQNAIDQNPRKSFNCQARSAAIYISLLRRMEKDEILNFLFRESKKPYEKPEQLGLF